MNYVSEYISQVQKAMDSVDQAAIQSLIELLKTARNEQKTIFVMGNGGSASTASHWVNDLVKGASYEKEQRFRVICLNDSISTLTAYSNDVSYEEALVQPLMNFLSPGDVVMAISGSGNSKNVIRAIEFAKKNGNVTVGLTGRDGGELGRIVDLEINVSDAHMGRIEDVHMMITHAVSWSFIENEKV